MTFMPWTEAHASQIEFFDADHKALYDCLNSLHTTAAGGDPDAIRRRLDWLSARIEDHFEREQLLMERSRYPHTRAHLDEHRDFLRTIHAIRRLYTERPQRVELAKVATFLKSAIGNHVLRSDAVLVAYLKGGGCGPAMLDPDSEDAPPARDRDSELVSVMVRVPAHRVDAIRGCGRLLRQGGPEAEQICAMAAPLTTMSVDEAASITAAATR